MVGPFLFLLIGNYVKKTLMKKLVNVFYTFGIFLLFIAIWLGFLFGKVSFGAVVFHLSLDSADKIDYYSLTTFILLVLLLPALISYFTSRMSIWLKVIATVGCFYYFLWHVGLVPFVQMFYRPDRMANYYQSVQLNQIKEKKNLVVIYVESLEKNFADKSLVKEDLIKELTALEESHVKFSDYQEGYGNDWTIASIIGSQCGIPLQLPFEKYLRINRCEDDKSFLGNALCLGDVLQKENYHQVFINGVDLKFAFVGDFFKTHKYDEVYGPNEIKKVFNRNFDEHFWGLSDASLMKVAKEKFSDLYKGNKPFNLTLLTVDTHAPHGMTSKECRDRFGNEPTYAEIIQCTSDAVSDFVKYVKENDTKNNTIILVMGDHLAKKNSLSNEINQKPRKIFASFMSNNQNAINVKDTVYAIDFYPMILNQIVDDKICKAGIGHVPGIFGCGKREMSEKKFKNIYESYSHLLKEFWCK